MSNTLDAGFRFLRQSVPFATPLATLILQMSTGARYRSNALASEGINEERELPKAL